MEKKIFQWKRPELSLAEVIDEYANCNVEKILHEVAIGSLTLYVRAEGWKVGVLMSINQVMQSVLQESNNSLTAEDFEALLPEFKEAISNKDIADKMASAYMSLGEEIENKFPNDDFQEIISTKLFSFYPNNGIYRAIYIPPILGLRPISTTAIRLYQMGVDPGVWLKLIDDFGISDNSTDEFVILPDPFITFKEALNDGKLFVMKADLDRLRGLSPDGNIYELMDHDYWPPELGIAIAAWQNAIEDYKPGDKPSAIIRSWLRKTYPTTNEMSDAAVERIVTIANWDKKPGPAENKDKDR